MAGVWIGSRVDLFDHRYLVVYCILALDANNIFSEVGELSEFSTFIQATNEHFAQDELEHPFPEVVTMSTR